MKNIVMLDIDDAIYPSPATTFWNNADLSIEQLEINLKKLVLFLDNTNSEIFITSSWYQILDFWEDSKSVTARDELYKYWGAYEKKRENKKLDPEYRAYKLISKYLNGRIIGTSCGDRVKDIKKLKEDKENKIIVFDDWDLTEIDGDNCKYYMVLGALTNNILCDAYKFLMD